MHAAGRYRNTADPVCAAEYMVSSYIPSLSALIKARRNWEPICRTRLASLLICEESSDTGLARRLPDASKEVSLARGHFESAGAQVLNAHTPHITVSSLRTIVRRTTAHVLHLACHGIQESNPLKSARLLQDGKFTIEDILRLNLLDAVLAYLSACQTAKGDRNAPNQAVHLAASMLFCGFKSVIGTIWCVRAIPYADAALNLLHVQAYA
jgi:CHAT domain-containing protein